MPARMSSSSAAGTSACGRHGICARSSPSSKSSCSKQPSAGQASGRAREMQTLWHHCSGRCCRARRLSRFEDAVRIGACAGERVDAWHAPGADAELATTESRVGAGRDRSSGSLSARRRSGVGLGEGSRCCASRLFLGGAVPPQRDRPAWTTALGLAPATPALCILSRPGDRLGDGAVRLHQAFARIRRARHRSAAASFPGYRLAAVASSHRSRSRFPTCSRDR
jgi:hypothetical protein